MQDDKKLTYRAAGVDISAGNEAVRLIKPIAESTFDSRVLGDIGSFAGLYSIGTLNLTDPILVTSTDGVGTKLRLAILMDKHDTVGIDLVAMSVNDILVQGAKPIFFLDYIAIGKLIPEKVLEIVKGIAQGCKLAGCALIGGETAEMPGFYAGDDYDLAGFAVGIVERLGVITGSDVALGDKVIGIASSGLHSNGYSLVRKVYAVDLEKDYGAPFNDSTLGETLLTPTKIYVKPVQAVLRSQAIHAMVHVTGGGLVENLPRVLPTGCRAEIFKDSWEIPYIFKNIQERGSIEDLEMYRTFNMGIGFILIVAPDNVSSVLTILHEHGEEAWVIGRIGGQDGPDRFIFSKDKG
ncbi:MAG: phosphoribosylformylglycinamidine cyclo-ligase [Deltaproteobacteria bacterium]|nr:phosphoribosylformylglycinamidine cyclo-ligase [Deltaproteobacteria bacterium]